MCVHLILPAGACAHHPFQLAQHSGWWPSALIPDSAPTCCRTLRPSSWQMGELLGGMCNGSLALALQRHTGSMQILLLNQVAGAARPASTPAALRPSVPFDSQAVLHCGFGERGLCNGDCCHRGPHDCAARRAALEETGGGIGRRRGAAAGTGGWCRAEAAQRGWGAVCVGCSRMSSACACWHVPLMPAHTQWSCSNYTAKRKQYEAWACQTAVLNEMMTCLEENCMAAAEHAC